MKHIRIIPRLDIKGKNVVKGIQTEGLRIVGKPQGLAEYYYREGADEIAYMDIVASLYRRSLDFDLLKKTSENIFIPFTVGGGIQSLHDINNALRSGADKIAINTYAIKHPKFLTEAANSFGAQCIVLSVEAKKTGPNSWEAYTDGGREHTGVDAIQWIKKAINLGVGEIFLTSIDKDGMRQGYELPLIKAVTAFSPIPVIAHGGARDPDSIYEAITEGAADAVAVGSIFHYKTCTIQKVKDRFINDQINVRWTAYETK